MWVADIPPTLWFEDLILFILESLRTRCHYSSCITHIKGHRLHAKQANRQNPLQRAMLYDSVNMRYCEQA